MSTSRSAVPRLSRLLVRLTGSCVTVVALVAAVVLAVASVGSLSGQWHLVPVLSDSMAPGMPRGALAVVRPEPADSLRPGEIVLFRAPIGRGAHVMHRVVRVEGGAGRRTFVTKGDANAAPDAWTIRVKGPTVWRVVKVMPKLGSAALLLEDPTLRTIALSASTALVLVIGLRRVWSGYEPRRRRSRRRRRAASAAVVATLVLALSWSATSAGAKFTHSPTPPVPAFGSGSLLSPAPATCIWAGANDLSFSYANTAPAFTTTYQIRRSTTSGSGYSTVTTVNGASTTTGHDLAPAPPTTRYYVIREAHGPWTGPNSNELISSQCDLAIGRYAGTGSASFSGDGGPATSARLNAPDSVAVDAAGNAYIADSSNNRIRKVSTNGTITTVVGGGANSACSYTGAGTNVSLNGPRQVAFDPSTGDILVADRGNNCVRRLHGSTVSGVAGGGSNKSCAYSGAATGMQLANPSGVAVDASGTVYVSDTGRNCVHRVSGSTLSLFAGSGSNSACSYSGPATSVSMSSPEGLAVDAAGSLYVADRARQCVRKVTGSTVSRVAGGGASTACSYAGAAGSVSLSGPSAVAATPSGAVLVSDSGRNCIRRVSGGTVTPWVGTGTAGSAGDGGPAVGATLRDPGGIAVRPDGDLLFADTGNSEVRYVVGGAN